MEKIPVVIGDHECGYDWECPNCKHYMEGDEYGGS